MLRRDTNFMDNLLKSAPSSYELRKLRMIADYQICKGAGKVLFPQEEITVTHSGDMTLVLIHGHHWLLHPEMLIKMEP